MQRRRRISEWYTLRANRADDELRLVPRGPHAVDGMDAEDSIRMRFEALAPVMDERRTRLWVASEARLLGRGGLSLVARATRIRAKRINAGLRDLDELAQNPPAVPLSEQRIRRSGGGRKRLEDTDPTLLRDLESLVEHLT